MMATAKSLFLIEVVHDDFAEINEGEPHPFGLEDLRDILSCVPVEDWGVIDIRGFNLEGATITEVNPPDGGEIIATGEEE
jgi:hypothetical protein